MLALNLVTSGRVVVIFLISLIAASPDMQKERETSNIDRRINEDEHLIIAGFRSLDWYA